MSETEHKHSHRHHHRSLRKALKDSSFIKHKVLRIRNVFSFISCVLSIIFLFSLYKINLLPMKYNLIITFVVIIINVFGIYAINVHRKTWLKVIGWILLIINMVISVIGSYYLLETNSFFDKSFNRVIDVSTTTYYVVSLKSNNLTKSDIKGDVSVYTNTYNIDSAFERLSDAFTVKKKEYDDLGLMFNDILNNNSKFMLIEASSYDLVFTIDDSLNKDDYSIIYEFNLVNKNIKNESNNTNKFNIFIGGRDFSNFFDFNAIATVNLDKHTVILTSIPRDYYINIPGTDTKEKLSFMGLYGADTNKKALEELLDIKLDYSIYFDARSVVDMVDYVGGIDYCSEDEYTTTHAMVVDTYNDSTGKKLYVKKGCQHVNGIEALTISRERKNVYGGDHQRQKNCIQILTAVMKKLATPKNALNYSKTLDQFSNLYETDINRGVFSALSKDAINNGVNNWEVKTQSLDGWDNKDVVNFTKRIDWVTYPDQTTIDNCKREIDNLLK